MLAMQEELCSNDSTEALKRNQWRILIHAQYFVRVGVHAVAPRDVAVAFAFTLRMDGVRQQRDGDALLRIHPEGCSCKASMPETARTYIQPAGTRLFR